MSNFVFNATIHMDAEVTNLDSMYIASDLERDIKHGNVKVRVAPQYEMQKGLSQLVELHLYISRSD